MPSTAPGSHNATPMSVALAEARAAAERGEVPVGAVIVTADGELIAKAGNRTREFNDPTAHAEMLAIREACRVHESQRLQTCDLFVTLEPCPMCAAAISFARIRRLYYGAGDPKSGGVDHGARVFAQSSCHHAPDVYSGIAESDATRLLQQFFLERRYERPFRSTCRLTMFQPLTRHPLAGVPIH